MSMPEATPAPDLSLRDLAQSVKLGEEVGELQAEVLGALEFQRREKAARYSRDTLGGELADVMVCVALLADTFGVDLAQAVGSKIEQLEARNRRPQAEIPG
jgi:NTP pyrophosphatase (non-canonical NTP hydrolase)